MLDHFAILARNGVVLWQHSFAASAASANASAVNALISSVFLEQRTGEARFDRDAYTARWSFANDYDGLAFIVVYQRILQLTYIDQLLASVQEHFTALFGPLIKTILAPAQAGSITPALQQQFAAALQSWNQIFLNTLRSLERAHAHGKRQSNHPAALKQPPSAAAALPPPSPGGARAGTPTDSTEIAKNVEALKNRLKNADLGSGPRGKRGAGGRVLSAGGGKGKKNAEDSGASSPGHGASGTASPNPTGGKKKGKEMRKWAEDGTALTASHSTDLDFSTSTETDAVRSDDVASRWVDERSLGVKGTDGTYELADVEGRGETDEDDEEEEQDLSLGASTAAAATGSSTNGGFLARLSSASGLFSRLTGSARPLTEADLQPVLDKMASHLQSKNVATEVAAQLCASVKQGLLGRQLGTFGSTKGEVRRALEGAIEQILTPKSSTDILREISAKRLAARAAAMAAASSAAAGATTTTRGGGSDALGGPAAAATDPYSICFVGVNGVGKSTNLAKVCFWLLQNDLRVLIAACDTFRAGAVEQLRTHVRNLGALRVGARRVDGRNEDGSAPAEGEEVRSNIELFEQGYGKDAAGIASLALGYAKKHAFDVVLIDTAGRMQDNEPLMRALAKLVSVNKPDKIVFVGEALVGNEAVLQLKGFDRALKDYSGVSNPKGLDGMLLTKFDTIDDKVGTTLTATAVTGLPIFFVGVGQSYTDLRTLRVRHIVDALMRD